MQASTLIKRALAVGAGILAAVAIAAPPASPGSKDRNHDQHPRPLGEAPWPVAGHRTRRHDQDRDGLNRGEFRAEFDPRDADPTTTGSRTATRAPGRSSRSTDYGELVINPFYGDTVNGMVTADTEIECDNDDERPARRPGDDGPAMTTVTTATTTRQEVPGTATTTKRPRATHGTTTTRRDCSAADLTAGTVVREAELELTASGLVFEEIELVGERREAGALARIIRAMGRRRPFHR